jgi:hypothetical protein
MEQRREFLWAPLMISQKSQRLERLSPAKRVLRMTPANGN